MHCFSGLVDVDSIKNYKEYRNTYIKKGRGKSFDNAVKHVEEYMSNRQVHLFFYLNE